MNTEARLQNATQLLSAWTIETLTPEPNRLDIVIQPETCRPPAGSDRMPIGAIFPPSPGWTWASKPGHARSAVPLLLRRGRCHPARAPAREDAQRAQHLFDRSPPPACTSAS